MTEKLLMIDQMNNMIAEQEAIIQQKDNDNVVFHDMFRSGLLKTNDEGNIQIVRSEKEQQRIAQGFIDSAQGNIESKSKEQIDFENVQLSRRRPTGE